MVLLGGEKQPQDLKGKVMGSELLLLFTIGFKILDLSRVTLETK